MINDNSKITSRELSQKLANLIQNERKITNEILELINIAFKKRSYLDLGFSSLFDWLVKGFGYSHAAAYRRIEAARLLRAIPEVAAKIQSGEVNLTTLSKASSMIRAQEKATNMRLSAKSQQEIVKSIQNRSSVEAEAVLFTLLPEAATQVHQERRYPVNKSESRLQMNISNQATQDLLRLKEVLSHKFPNATDAQIITYALSELIKRLDPLKKTPANKSINKVTEIEKEAETGETGGEKEVRQKEILRLANGECEFKDHATGQVCKSRYQVQLDHIQPKAFGGSDNKSNLRLLCRSHNMLMAERAFGKQKMQKYW